MGSGKLLLLASLPSYVSAATDGISITGNVADSSVVHVKTMEIGEVRAAIDPLPAPSSVVDANIVEKEAGVPPLVLEEVTDDGTTGRSAIDPLPPPEGVASAVGERIISEPPMPISNLDPPRAEKPQVQLLLLMLQ